MEIGNAYAFLCFLVCVKDFDIIVSKCAFSVHKCIYHQLERSVGKEHHVVIW